ncbi:tRNA1(Val) (adenine(37)-N6)-methyltransferase [Lactobacillaceae bacterium Scapto_B20]
MQDIFNLRWKNVEVDLKPNERIDQLYSQSIQVIQNSDVFSFSLDAILLANFIKVPKSAKTKMVDLCAGNGAVGLFSAHKTRGHIFEVEIQPKLADMANRSIELNNLQDQFSVYNIDLKDVYQSIPKDSVDIVACNPPYFPDIDTSKKNPNPHLAIARHEIKTNLDKVLEMTGGLLKTNGRCYFVYRPDRLLELLDKMRSHRIAPKEIVFVYPRSNRDANMVLVSGIKDGKLDGLKVKPPMVVYQDGSDEYTEVIHKILYGK